MRRSIKSMASALLAAVLLTQPLTALADTADRTIVTDDMYLEAVDGALEWERERIGGELAEGFVSSGMAGGSEADWFIMAECLLGISDDYGSYISTVGEPEAAEGELLTEPARSSVTLAIAGGRGTDMENVPLDAAGCNELVWATLAQRMNGFDSSAAESLLYGMQQPDGGFGLRGSDADITAMALTVLEGEPADRAEKWLKDNGESMTCETAAWCIIAACSRGDRAALNDDYADSSGTRPIDVLFACRSSDGGFSHTAGGESEVISTAQALTALAALAEYDAGGGGIFDSVRTKPDIRSQDNIAGESKYALDQLAKIEQLNSEIRSDYYPPEEIKLTHLPDLIGLNDRIETVAPCYRHYIIARDELAARESRLKKMSAAGVAFGAVWKIAALIFLVRFRKTKLAKKLYKKYGRYLPGRKKKKGTS